MAISREIITELEDVAPGLSAAFNRLVISIDNELAKRSTIQKQTKLPPNPVDGKLYYFTQTISPDITSIGLWFYKGSTWVNIA